MPLSQKLQYYSHRIDPKNEENYGDFAVRVYPTDSETRHMRRVLYGQSYSLYHYASQDYDGPHGASLRGEVVDPDKAWHIPHSDPRHQGCIQAVEHLGKHIVL